MKRTIITLLNVLFCALIFAQTIPQGINYQGVARDANGDELTNQSLTVKLSVISSSTGTIPVLSTSWQETHAVTTNDYGLFTSVIGQGTSTAAGSSATFNLVDWGAASHYLKVEIDAGNGYLDMGTNELLSVPYALQAGNPGPQGATGPAGNDGAAGATGAQGPIGLTGATGPAGNNGTAGATGAQGPIGLTGPAGATGATGPAGNDGAAGATGAQGPIGATGPAGNDGAAGTTGAQGPIGLTGATGPAGNNGATGATGPAGNNGTAGATGAQGPVGATGPMGPAGVGIAQNLSVSGDTIFISYGNYIIIPGISLANTLIVNGCTDSTATNYDPLANTDDGSCIYSLAIGDTYQGGIIFWLDGNGGGLIAAPSDQSSGAQWGCYGTQISGADGIAIGTGNQNTIDIEAGCTTPGTAADICANLTLGGYSDWFLPSKDELNEMYLNLHQQGLGGFANSFYWSSTEYDSNDAWDQNFVNGNQSNYYKNDYFNNVRAVRAF